ncbi:phage holin family protein [Tissierella sp. Yu-01]|uniref:phage holin family protein n=1 Tax=Tissierella sp. Yu-01 TaxID=3035694 RepID=UPI00240DAA1F|nr:phage holin family protein [Tissierella sp. Yu-01]WFA10321.1 phage holin family protein [Tissierella sp. Yu-01]
MEKLTNIKTSVFAVVGVVGSVITNLIGGWDKALQVLLIFMVIDYASGLILAGVFKKSKKSETGALESRVGWKGICKKVMTLLIVLMGSQLDILLGLDYIRYGLIIGFIIDEGMSIIENYGLMGFKLPEMLSNAFDILRKHKETKVEVKQ